MNQWHPRPTLETCPDPLVSPASLRWITCCPRGSSSAGKSRPVRRTCRATCSTTRYDCDQVASHAQIIVGRNNLERQPTCGRHGTAACCRCDNERCVSVQFIRWAMTASPAAIEGGGRPVWEPGCDLRELLEKPAAAVWLCAAACGSRGRGARGRRRWTRTTGRGCARDSPSSAWGVGKPLVGDGQCSRAGEARPRRAAAKEPHPARS